MYDSTPDSVINLTRLEMDYSKYLNKPFFIGEHTWDTTQTYGTSISNLQIPESIFLYNDFLAAPFRQSCYYRARVKLYLQAAGTVNHSGMVVAYAQPLGSPTMAGGFTFNSALVCPHTFIFANQSNPVEVEVPFFNNFAYKAVGEADTLQFSRENTTAPQMESFSQVTLSVVNPLFAGASGSTSISISVHAEFMDMEFFVPKAVNPTWFQVQTLSESATNAIDGIFSVGRKFTMDFFDAARSVVRSYTGLHNPNQAAPVEKVYTQQRNNPNVVDCKVLYDKLDPYVDYSRFSDHPYFKTQTDEMDMGYLLSKPQHIGTFTVSTLDTSGTLLFSRPMYPIMEPGPNFSAIQSLFALLSLGWRGDIELHVQSVMNNFQYCKILVAKDYSKVLKTNHYPNMASQTALPTDTLEFAGGGVIRTVEVPFQSQASQLPISTDWTLDAFSHGIIRFYLAQPLVVSNNAPTTATFNVYIKCKPNFRFVGYSTRNFSDQHPQQPPPATIRMEVQSGSGEIDVVADQATLELPKKEPQISNDNDMRPIYNVRDYVRRLCHVGSIVLDPFSATNSSYSVKIDVASLLGVYNPFSDYKSKPFNALNPFQLIRKMYLGYRGGIKFKFRVRGVASCQLYYVPPLPFVEQGLGKEHQWGAMTPWLPVVNNEIGFDMPMLELGEVNQILKFPLPIVETPNMTVATSITRNAYDAIPGSTHILEGEIPYMNVADFVGSANVISDGGDTSYPRYADSLGYLVLSYAPMTYTNDTTDPVTEYADGYLDMFVGADDSARLGMQVFSPVVRLQNDPDSAGHTFQPYTPYHGTTLSAHPAYTCPACWFTKTA